MTAADVNDLAVSAADLDSCSCSSLGSRRFGGRAAPRRPIKHDDLA